MKPGRDLVIVGVAAVTALVVGTLVRPAAVRTASEPITLRFAPEDRTLADQVAYVAMGTRGAAVVGSVPIWADLAPDKVAHILRMIREAKPAPDPIGVPDPVVCGSAAWVRYFRQS